MFSDFRQRLTAPVRFLLPPPRPFLANPFEKFRIFAIFPPHPPPRTHVLLFLLPPSITTLPDSGPVSKKGLTSSFWRRSGPPLFRSAVRPMSPVLFRSLFPCPGHPTILSPLFFASIPGPLAAGCLFRTSPRVRECHDQPSAAHPTVSGFPPNFWSYFPVRVPTAFFLFSVRNLRDSFSPASSRIGGSFSS